MQLQPLKHQNGFAVKHRRYADMGFQLTLRNLSGQRGGNGDEVQVSASIVDGHLPALPKVVGVGVALRHEQIQRKAPVHQNACRARPRITMVALGVGILAQFMRQRH